jgi:DNA-binding NarL/FixJ family response regulator
MSTGYRVLIVEDHAGARAWLECAVHAAFPNCEITTASDVAGATLALAQSLENLPELALIDLGLPDGDGTDLVRALKTRAPDAVVVVATMFDDDAHLFPALCAGAQGYVLKDETCEELARMLQGISAGQPPLSASIARRVLQHFTAPSASHARLSRAPEASAMSAGEHLTERECDTLKLLAKGFNVPKIATLLGISKHTVAGYVRDVYRKLNLSSRAEATMAAAQRGFVSVEQF